MDMANNKNDNGLELTKINSVATFLMNYKELISTKGFRTFIISIRSYCELIESNVNENYLVNLQKSLLEIYSQAINLKTIELVSNVEFEEKLNDIEFERIKNQTSVSLGEIQCYWTIFDPTENVFGNEKPIMGDLLDDIMDIYKDLKYQLMILDINTKDSIENAVWGMKFDFWYHWSSHAIDAMRTIHYVIEKTEKYK